MKKLFNVLIISLLSVALISCAPKTNAAENSSTGMTENNETQEVSNTTNEEEQKKYYAHIYFPTTEYVVDGKEDEKMKSKEISIISEFGIPAQSVVDILIAGPEAEGIDGVETAVFEEQIKDVTFSDGIVTVDVNGSEMSGSSLEEELFINQIVESLLSIEDVTGVRFTVDGETVESLMGHYSASEVFTKGV